MCALRTSSWDLIQICLPRVSTGRLPPHARMSNPNRAPKEPTRLQLSLASAPDSYLPDGFQNTARQYKRLEVAQSSMSNLDMETRPSFYLPKEWSVLESVRTSNTPRLAQASLGVPTGRARSALAKGVVNAAFGVLPDSGIFSKESVGRAMAGKVFVEGGTNAALGRVVLAYPKRNVMIARPITADEADGALRRCGLSMGSLPVHARRPFPLLPKEGEEGISVNSHSDNGFPVGGKWDTPGAAAKVMELALAVRSELLMTESVADWKRDAETARPWLVACCGKAKADYYAQEKVVDARLRFYNVLPRQILLNQQMATQPFERLSRSILDDHHIHTGIGITLTKGGAADLVEALQRQLDEEGTAYVHVGDDSWVVVRDGDEYVMFALDCSNFDLTQHHDGTRAVHDRVRQELGLFDRKAADLWHAYARSRLIVVQGALTRVWKHAGPSGMPLQSKVNDMLMDVLIQRVLARLSRQATEAEVDAVIAAEGRALGFSIRVEQFWRGRAKSLAEVLQRRPFLFIGYYFHVRGTEVQVCADVPRTFAQVPFPAQKWAKSSGEFLVREAARLGSIAMNLGMAPIELEPAFTAFRNETLKVLDRAIETHGDVRDARLKWAVQASVWGAESEASLAGLRRAVERDPRSLWMVKERELPSTSALVYGNWADEVEAAEDAYLARLGPIPPMVGGIRRAALPPPVVPTHPVTSANDGRTPPTAVWGPPKAPRDVMASSARQRRRDGTLRREFDRLMMRDDDDGWDDEWSDSS